MNDELLLDTPAAAADTADLLFESSPPFVLLEVAPFVGGAAVGGAAVATEADRTVLGVFDNSSVISCK